MSRRWDNADRQTLVLTIDGIDGATSGREIATLARPAVVRSAKALASGAIAGNAVDWWDLNLVVDGEVIASASHETDAFDPLIPRDLTLTSNDVGADKAIRLALAIGGGAPADLTGTTLTVTVDIELK